VRKILFRYLAISLSFLATTTPLSQASTDAQAKEAFRKLQSLAGNWQGKDEQGNPTKSSFVQVASGTAVMETLTMPGMDEMLTLYSVDVNTVVLAHYCPTNNQPRMRAFPSFPSAGDLRELAFEFSGAGNLPDMAAGHEHRLVIQFEDRDHITERWTWRKGGKDTEMVFHLTRTPPANN
jgi:hypothetical protein